MRGVKVRMMKCKLSLIATALVTSGCASLDDRPCVVIENPYEVTKNGTINGKVHVKGPVQVALPLTRKVTEDFRNDPAIMAGLAGGLSAAGHYGAAAAVNSVVVPSTPYPPSLGDLCPTSRVVEGAYKYSVSTTDGEKHTVFGLWPNHEIGDCVKVFFAPDLGGRMQGRIASNGICD